MSIARPRWGRDGFGGGHDEHHLLRRIPGLRRSRGRGGVDESVSARDKEFHFQNWFEARLRGLDVHFDSGGRNAYPDFSMVDHAEGYEVKGLAWPGRERNYDANSQAPTGLHNGRRIFYVFGRYPADLRPYAGAASGRPEYPVVDLVVCHGDFLNADHEYVHENKNVKGFGTYGDIMVRDRKMYVAPHRSHSPGARPDS